MGSQETDCGYYPQSVFISEKMRESLVEFRNTDEE